MPLRIKYYDYTLDTDGSGNIDHTTDEIFSQAFLYAMRYQGITGSGTLPYASGVDFDIRLESNDQPVWVENDVTQKVVYPRMPTHDAAGIERLAAVGVPFRSLIPIVNDRVRIRVSNGGNSNGTKYRGMIWLFLIEDIPANTIVAE